MTISKALIKYSKIEIDLLLSAVLQKSREFVFMNREFRLTRMQANRLTRMAARRLKGEPIAYILGYKDFMGLRFKVNKNVLVPRPETEVLVHQVLKVCSIFSKASLDRKAHKVNTKKHMRILDMGTGSGCVIVSLAKTLAAKGAPCMFYASDISKKALAVARHNAKNILNINSNTSKYWNKCRVEFLRSDLLENIKLPMDIIVANLPYVSKNWKDSRNPESRGLKFEPKVALYAKKNGLEIIERLLLQVAGLKGKPRRLFLEFDPRQKRNLERVIKKILPHSRAQFYKDYAQHWRLVEISL